MDMRVVQILLGRAKRSNPVFECLTKNRGLMLAESSFNFGWISFEVLNQMGSSFKGSFLSDLSVPAGTSKLPADLFRQSPRKIVLHRQS